MTTTLTLVQLGWKPFFAQQLQPDEHSDCYAARVAALYRGHLTLWSEHGEHDHPRELFARLGPLAVGDWVLMRPDDPHPLRLLERQSLVQRKAAGERAERQLIAANLDALLIVSSCNLDFNEARLERYLALALEAGVIPLVVLTKADLVDDAADWVVQAQALHQGLWVEAVNARDAATLDGIRQWCGPGQTLALVGSSGVGKSTLINSLSADRQATAAIREDDSKGRHTTTARSLHWLTAGGLLVDTPGMRELQLADCEQGLDQLFEDVSRYLGQCRFNDCRHESEPGCAIQQALANGELSVRRWQSYEKLRREQEHNSQSLAARRAQDKSLGRYYKSVQAGVRRRKKPDPDESG